MACEKCTNGKVLVPALGRWVRCPNCNDLGEILEEGGSRADLFKEALRIPKNYGSLTLVDTELLNSEVRKYYTQDTVRVVETAMQKINEAVYNGEVYNMSMYMHLSNLVDVKPFVFGVQLKALEQGMTVTPYLSANTLYGIQIAGNYPIEDIKQLERKAKQMQGVHPDTLYAVDGYREIKETELTYYDYINADVVFIEATPNTHNKGWTAVADLLCERARKGRPTYVMGYWASYTQGSTGLRYILLPPNSVYRLDMLATYEVISNNSNDKYSNVQQKQSLLETTESEKPKTTISEGLSVTDIMGGMS